MSRFFSTQLISVQSWGRIGILFMVLHNFCTFLIEFRGKTKEVPNKSHHYSRKEKKEKRKNRRTCEDIINAN